VGNLAISFGSSASFALLTSCLYQQGIQKDVAQREWLSNLQKLGVASQARKGRLWLYAGAGFAILAAGLLVGVGLLSTVRFEDQTSVTAHRGAAGSAPENTLASVKRAIEDGARWVEIDVQENADGEVVVIHDSDFKKVAGLDLKVHEATSRELRQIDIGSWFAPQFRKERVPTLAQVLELCKDKAGVNIELKYYGKNQRLEERVVEIVEAQGMADDVLIMSLKRDGVRKIRDLRPSWKIGLLVTVAMGDLSQLDVDFLAVNTSLASLAFIQKAHDHGKEVFVWTVNDPLVMATMASRGADSLITDEPARAGRVLREINTLSPIERVLLHIGGELGMLREGKHASRAREEGM
jgi:glycerophosphoryl diester phosphodiesterase